MNPFKAHLSKKRPDFVSFIFAVFCFASVMSVGVYGLTFFSVITGRVSEPPLIDVVTVMVVWGVRAAGFVRLFCMRDDAWFYLLAAIILNLPMTLLNLYANHALNRVNVDALAYEVAGYAFAVAISTYAFLLSHRNKPHVDGSLLPEFR